MMILPIGNKPHLPQRRTLTFSRRRFHDGYTFIEVLLALTIFSVGIVSIFKSFFTSLDYMNHLTYRLYATNVLDNRLAYLERALRETKTVPKDMEPTVTVRVGETPVTFTQEVNVTPIEQFPNLYHAEVSLDWDEGRRHIHLSRATYISDFRF